MLYVVTVLSVAQCGSVWRAMTMKHAPLLPSHHTRFRYQEDVQSVPGCLVSSTPHSSMDQLSPLDLTTTQIPRRSSVSDGESGTSRSGSPSLSVTPTPCDISSGDHHFTTKRFLYKYQAQQSESLVNNEDLITYGKIRAELYPERERERERCDC